MTSLCLFIVTFFVLHVQADQKCRFPHEWKGRWFQSRLGIVTIRSGSILPKGTCIQNSSDLYLIRDRKRDCFQCLLTIFRHENLIQYRESYCLEKNTLEFICARIRVEDMLYTLVREANLPSKCPFREAFNFNYNDGRHKSCDSTPSYAKPCAGESRYQFRFRHCEQAALFNNKDFEFECVADWKDGSDLFLYGRMSGSHVESSDERYKCFKYQISENRVTLAMSADATCFGLRSFQESPIRLNFERDTSGWPKKWCTFPHELAGSHWTDLAMREELRIEGGKQGRMLWYSTKRRGSETKTHLKSEVRCLKVLREDSLTRKTLIVGHIISRCSVRRQCLLIEEKHPNLLELHRGLSSELSDDEACLTETLADVVTLIPRYATPSSCPFPGRHTIVAGPAACNGYVTSGCNDSTTMSIECLSAASASAASTAGNHQPSVLLECLVTWSEANTTYAVVRSAPGPGREHSLINVLMFISSVGQLVMTTNSPRNIPLRQVFDFSLSLTLPSLPERCDGRPAYLQEVLQSQSDSSHHQSSSSTSDSSQVSSSQSSVHFSSFLLTLFLPTFAFLCTIIDRSWR